MRAPRRHTRACPGDLFQHGVASGPLGKPGDGDGGNGRNDVIITRRYLGMEHGVRPSLPVHDIGWAPPCPR
jgi:hypothetical protein